MTPRSRILWFGSAGALVVAGIVCAAAVSGTVGQVLAFSLIALGFVLATGLVFLEVGLSEDKERARAQSAAEREESAPETPRLLPHQQRSTPRLGRLRGSRRRLR